jgi:hypothetical protein
MNKELLVKVWIGLIVSTGIVWIIVNSYNPTFTGVFLVFHIAALFLGLVLSLIGIKKKEKFSKHLLVVSLLFLIISLIALYFLTCGFVGCLILA